METQNDVNNNTLNFGYEVTAENHSIIKVVGVGGGGSNAVTNMYNSNIEDVSFLIVNTDRQALMGSPIPNKLLISKKGLGAGAKPEVAREYAEECTEQIRQALSDGTEMVFITAGMGGGTGTGAAPVVAQIAQEMGILTIGIVTIPFRFEGKRKIMMALEGVRKIEKWCDALLVVNNNRLIDVYPDLNFGNAFCKADDTLTTAAKSISDIINKQGYINLDFADVSTTLRNGGVALISTGTAKGENRLTNAIKAATTSPLLQDNNYTDAKHLLFELCFSHSNPLSMAEMDEMNKFVDGLNSEIDVIWGAMYDDDLGDNVRIILLASGFSMDHSGKVFAGDRVEARIREMQERLRKGIIESKNHLVEFDGYTAATEVLLEAQRQASNKADNLSIEDSVEEELAKLDIALEKARQKKDEVIAAKAEAEAHAAEEARRKAIAEKIAILQAQLDGPEAPTETAQPEPIAEAPVSAQAPEPTPAAQPAEGSTPVSSTTTTPTPSAPVKEPSLFDQPEEPVDTETPAPAPKPSRPIEAPATASTPLEGIDSIRHFYGDEVANKMELDQTRKAYYVLDDKDLTNEQLIERLRALPAYNRSLEDLGQLRAISRQPAQPKVIGKHDGPDGTIKF